MKRGLIAMTRKRDTSHDRVTIGGVVYMTLVDYANVHCIDASRLRRNARNGNIPMATNVMVGWKIPETMPVPTFATRGPRSVHDGKRMIVYAPRPSDDPDGFADFMSYCDNHGIDVVDPSAKRAERKRNRNRGETS